MENRVKSEKHMLSHPIEDEVLDYIVENYHQLIQTNASYLAEVIVHLAESFQKKGLRTGFIKRWMEKAFEIDEQNKKALSYLSKYRLYEQIHKINSFEFRPLRESDTKSQKETTISEYRITIDQFLDNIDHIIFNLGNDKNKLDSQQDQTIISLYNKALAQIEELKEEIIILDNILHDRQENARRTLYSMSNFEQVQKSVNRINELMKNVRLLSKVDEKEKKEKSALNELNEMIGLSEVKKRISDFYQYLKFQKARKEAGFETKDEISLNMIILGNPGTGKTSVARLLAKIYYELGVLPSEEVIETNRSQLVGSYVGQTEENVRMIVEKALGGVLFIDEAYSLKREDQSGSDYGQTAIDTLVSIMTSKEYGGKFSVILAGYPEEMRQFLHANTGLRSRFPQSNIIELPDYSIDELIQIADKIALENEYLLTAGAKKELKHLIKKEQVDHTFGNARAVHNLIMEAIFKKGVEQTIDLPDVFHFSILKEADFRTEDDKKIEKQAPMEKLNALVGLKEVKKAVKTYISFVKMQTLRRKNNLPTVPIQLHSVFTGNPGTGKTTVAKIYAELLKEIGILKRGHLIVAGRADLIAGYVGQSAIKTKKKIREALGGVLFIDEAYALFRNNNQDFGKEVIDTIVEEMTVHGENLVIILAGYPKEINTLLESNPGLKSRFKKFFHFEDYNADELIEIMKHFAQKYAYTIEKDALDFLYEELLNKPPKGNGRFIENLIHEAIQQQSLRLVDQFEQLDTDEVNLLTREDIKLSYNLLKKGE